MADIFANANALLEQFRQRGEQSYNRALSRSPAAKYGYWQTRGDSGEEYRMEQRDAQKDAERARTRVLSGITDALPGALPDVASIIAQRTAAGQDRLEAQRNAAIQQIMQRNAQLAEQSRRTLSQPIGVPNVVAQQAPIEGVSDVGTDAALAGTNAATQSFHLAPESTQSQYSVGAPVGGGGIGARQKPSTNDLTTDNTNFGGTKQKDEL